MQLMGLAGHVQTNGHHFLIFISLTEGLRHETHINKLLLP